MVQNPTVATVSVVSDRFVLGVDLDGCCADHEAAFRQVVALERGVSPDSIPAKTSWGFHEWGLDDDAFNELHRRAISQHRMMRWMPVIEGAAEALWRLSDAGAWIRIVTHRLYGNWSHKSAVADTVEWLDDAKIPYRDICFLGAKPEVEAHAYIDDAPHNIEGLRAHGNHVIIFDQAYNHGIDGARARNWTEVEQQVLELMSNAGLTVQPQFPGIDAGADRLATRVEGAD